jgi:hypothetical protein
MQHSAIRDKNLLIAKSRVITRATAKTLNEDGLITHPTTP